MGIFDSMSIDLDKIMQDVASRQGLHNHCVLKFKKISGTNTQIKVEELPLPLKCIMIRPVVKSVSQKCFLFFSPPNICCGYSK